MWFGRTRKVVYAYVDNMQEKSVQRSIRRITMNGKVSDIDNPDSETEDSNTVFSSEEEDVIDEMDGFIFPNE